MDEPKAKVAVIFSSQRTPEHEAAYTELARRMEDLAQQQPGFCGLESARGTDGFGITVSYWTDEASARAWKAHSDHLDAQAHGRDSLYAAYTVRVANLTRQYDYP